MTEARSTAIVRSRSLPVMIRETVRRSSTICACAWALRSDRRHALLDALRAEVLVPDEPRPAQDRRERRPQLVGDRREELVLHAVRVLGPDAVLLRLGERLLLAAEQPVRSRSSCFSSVMSTTAPVRTSVGAVLIGDDAPAIVDPPDRPVGADDAMDEVVDAPLADAPLVHGGSPRRDPPGGRGSASRPWAASSRARPGPGCGTGSRPSCRTESPGRLATCPRPPPTRPAGADPPGPGARSIRNRSVRSTEAPTMRIALPPASRSTVPRSNTRATEPSPR